MALTNATALHREAMDLAEEASIERRGKPAAASELASFTPLVVSRPA